MKDLTSDVYRARRHEEAQRVAYRAAAASGLQIAVHPEAHVQVATDGSGAFVEVVVWVPASELPSPTRPAPDPGPGPDELHAAHHPV